MKVLHLLLLAFYLQTFWDEERSIKRVTKAFISSEVIPKGLKKIGTYEVQRQQIYFCLLVDGV